MLIRRSSIRLLKEGGYINESFACYDLTPYVNLLSNCTGQQNSLPVLDSDWQLVGARAFAALTERKSHSIMRG